MRLWRTTKDENGHFRRNRYGISGKSYIETPSQKPTTTKKKHTSKLTAKTGEKQRKREIPRDKLEQTKKRRATQEAAQQR